jgi:thiamine-monophosphate kinase
MNRPTEDALVDEVRALLASDDALLVPPGHDCGAVELEGGVVVATTDALVEGVHFAPGTPWEAVGAKALLVNLSDLAAAAALPVGFEAAVVAPPDRAAEALPALARGLADVARRFACPCLGGDLNAGPGPVVVAVTVVGRPGPGGLVTRAGARAGDVLSVTGPLGGAGAGRHLAPRPRLEEAQTLVRHGVPHAMMDLSDGLGLDLARLARASGVGAWLDADAVPVHPDVVATARGSALEHALGDGEDFELLVAHAPLAATDTARLAAEGVTLLPVGRVVDRERGLRLRHGDETVPLVARGWDHLRAQDAEGA